MEDNMTPVRYELWEKVPGSGEYMPYLLHYQPQELHSNGAVLLVPGSGYRWNPSGPVQEGKNVAEFLCGKGINVFVLIYRVMPDGCYPYPILDGRRGMRYVRYHAERFGIDPHKIITLGYSAGGHLCASLVSWHEPLEGEGADEIDRVDYVPDYQALCYPVISFDTSKPYTHRGSVQHLLGEKYRDLADALCFERTAQASVPPTFIFHNFDDASVGVENSLLYACRLRELGASVEMHIYPDGGHGVGFERDHESAQMHNRDWLYRFTEWLVYRGLLQKGE